MENYQIGTIIRYKDSNYEVVLDNIVSDKSRIGNDEFIFDELVIRGKKLYFVSDKKMHNKYSGKSLPVGFWHTIINNQVEIFNFKENFQFKVDSNNEVLFIENSEGAISTGISYKAAPNIIELDLIPFEDITVETSSYSSFLQIKSPAQKREEVRKKQRKLVSKYTVFWLIVCIFIGLHYFYIKQQVDSQKSINKNLRTEYNSLNIRLNNIKNTVVINDNIALKHINRMLIFSSSNVEMFGILNLINNKNKFSFKTSADSDMVKHIATTNNIPIKLKYDFMTKSSNVNWSID